jgi:hypothetical protein
VNGTTTMALNANLTSGTANWKFTFLAGMTIPAGATNIVCTSPDYPGGLPYTVPTSRGLCTATLAYYPATFWKKENLHRRRHQLHHQLRRPDAQALRDQGGQHLPSGRSMPTSCRTSPTGSPTTASAG